MKEYEEAKVNSKKPTSLKSEKLAKKNKKGTDFRNYEEFGDASKVHYVHVKNGNKKLDFLDVNSTVSFHNENTFGVNNTVSERSYVLDFKTMNVLRKMDNVKRNQSTFGFDKSFEFVEG